MTHRAMQLAQRFEEANARAISAVEACDAAAWRATSRDERWPAAYTAWHMANAQSVVLGIVSAVANGQPVPPITSEMLDAVNAENLAKHGDASKEEVLETLRRNGAGVAEQLRALTDEQLDRAASLPLLGGASVSAEQLADLGLIGHLTGHLASMQATA